MNSSSGLAQRSHFPLSGKLIPGGLVFVSALEPAGLSLPARSGLSRNLRVPDGSEHQIAHPVDDTPAPEKTPEPGSGGGILLESSQLLAQYSRIGIALCACEAVSWRVGVPWLPRTMRVRAFPSVQEKTCEEHLRFALVGISTKTLESYCEDLDSLSARSLESLHIPDITPFERRVYCSAAILVGTVVGFLIGTLLGAVFTTSLLLVTSAAISCGILAVLTSTETYRRTTFSWLVEAEIRRRLGGHDPSSNNLRICPTANS